MLNTRPTREAVLTGIGYQPLVCPEGVPAEVCEAEDRELQDYLVGWAQGAWDHVTAYEREQVKAAGLEPGSAPGSALGQGLEKGHRYGCTMVDIDPAGDIGGMMAELRSEIDRADLAGQGLEPESHVTVRYGILADRDLNGLRQYLRSLEPFEIRFGVVSSFPATEHSDNAAVLKVDVGSPVLDEINAAISQHVSFKPANFEYHSNATLAYVTPEAVDKYVGNDLLVGQTMEVTSISITMPDMPAEIVPLIGEHAHWHDEPAEKLAKYSDDQERDDNGRWTSDGTSVNHTVSAAISESFHVMALGGFSPDLAKACGEVKIVSKPPADIRAAMRSGENVAGCYVDGQVWINPAAPDMDNRTDRLGVVLHEIGHHVEERVRRAAVQREMGWDREAFKAAADAAHQEFRSFQKQGDKVHPAVKYAITDKHEWHAEAVRFYFSEPKGMKGFLPKTYAFWNGVVTGSFKSAAEKLDKAESESLGTLRLTGGRTAEGTYYSAMVREAKKMDLVASEHRCNKRAQEPCVVQARHEMQATLQHFFTKTANAIAATIRDHQKVAKASGADSLIGQLPGIDWQGVVPSLAINLKKISKAGAARAISSLNIDASRMISDINEVAADWAEQRAAEMVGMRLLPSGRLVQNADAQWNISDKTRDDLRDIITEAFEKKTSLTELSQQIRQAGVFSEQRAALIAKTEAIRAENQGNLAGWKTSGMVESIDVVLSANHADDSDCECTEAAENGPYPPDQVPELPLHPGCECDYVVVELVGQGDD